MQGAEAGIWKVPAGFRHLQWTVVMEVAGRKDASAQSSIASADGRFLLLSEAASIPRLANAPRPELLQLPPDLVPDTVPVPNSGGAIPLPDPAKAPLFVLLNPTPVASAAIGRVHLTFYIDDPDQREALPDIEKDVHALSWLVSLAPDIRNTDFRIAWLGITDASPSMGGATGSGLLLANYRRRVSTETVSPSSTITTAIPLFEAIHQIRGQFGKPAPRWVEESLITFFGLKALSHENPDDKGVQRIAGKFLEQAKTFEPGLLEIQRHVEAGDPSQYGAFFTKGFAFWTALDRAVRRHGRGGLDRHMPEVMSADYDSSGRPDAKLARQLGLPKNVWNRLCEVYLGT